ncbi:MAG: PAS domain-containing protein, partial [Deltaproteobacteria bacterium]|nr:PAS domain-containing protein [Deltaproteobacteria bacterium]
MTRTLMSFPSTTDRTTDKVDALIDSLRCGVIFEDERGIVVEANQAFCRMWDVPFPAHALVGRPMVEVGWPQDTWFADPAVVRQQWEQLVSAREATFDQEVRTTDGRIIEVDHVPVRMGECYGGSFWIYRDATQRRGTEDEIRTLNHELEQRVSQRTHELARTNRELADSLRRLRETQEQLIHAGKMAAVGTLVAGLSHELNNPLGIIVGYVQGLLRRMPEQAPGRDSLAAVERQALRCAHLVRSLLDFSRSKPATREQTALGPLIERVLELAAGQARRRKVELRWMARSSIPDLTACSPEIESALLNLVSNAIDATAPGGSAAVVCSAATHLDRAGIEVCVTDTGTGIPRAILPRIFDPFFTTKPVGEGTGIGLSLTRQIVEGHDGRIDVRTAEGVGTTVRLWLPLKP